MEYEMSSDEPRPSRRKMKSCGGQKCWDGSSGKSVDDDKMAKYSRKKRKVKKAEPEQAPTMATHMNMRNLSGESGDVSYEGQVKSSGKVDYESSPQPKFRRLEVDRTKTRRFFGK